MNQETYNDKVKRILGHLDSLFHILQELEISKNPFPDFQDVRKEDDAKIEKFNMAFKLHFKNDNFERDLKSTFSELAAMAPNASILNKDLIDIAEKLERHLEYTLTFQVVRRFNAYYMPDDENWQKHYKANEWRFITLYNAAGRLWHDATRYISNPRFDSTSKFYKDHNRNIPVYKYMDELYSHGRSSGAKVKSDPISFEDSFHNPEDFKRIVSLLIQEKYLEEKEGQYYWIPPKYASSPMYLTALFDTLSENGYLKEYTTREQAANALSEFFNTTYYKGYFTRYRNNGEEYQVALTDFHFVPKKVKLPVTSVTGNR